MSFALLAGDPGNPAAYAALRDALRTGGTLALVGEGCGARAGYPGRAELIERMAERARRLGPRAEAEVDALSRQGDWSWRAERCRALIGPDAYGALLLELYRPRAPGHDSMHEDLVRLPFRHVLTTAYDPALELAHAAVHGAPPASLSWTHRAAAEELLRRARDPGLGRRYVYLHGRHDEPASVVLTEDDPAADDPPMVEAWLKLCALPRALRVAVIGCRLAEIDRSPLFRGGRSRGGEEQPAHFAILHADDGLDLDVQRARLAGRFGITPIFYRGDAGLGDILRRLVADTLSAHPEAAVDIRGSGSPDSALRPEPADIRGSGSRSTWRALRPEPDACPEGPTSDAGPSSRQEPADVVWLDEPASLSVWLAALRDESVSQMYAWSLDLPLSAEPAGEAVRAATAWIAGKLAAELESRGRFARDFGPARVVLRGEFHALALPLSGAATPSPLPARRRAPPGGSIPPRRAHAGEQRIGGRSLGARVEAGMRAWAEAAIGAVLEPFQRAGALPAAPPRAAAAELVRAYGRDAVLDPCVDGVRVFGHDFLRHFGLAGVRDIGRTVLRDFGRGLLRGFVRAFFRDYGGDLHRDLVRDFVFDLAIDPDRLTGRPPREDLQRPAEGAARAAHEVRFWDVYAWRTTEAELEAGGWPPRILFETANPLAVPLLLSDLVDASLLGHLLGAARHAAGAPGGGDPDLGEAWLEDNPFTVYPVALAWEALASSFASIHGRLAGPPGALLLLHAAYAGLMTGLECDAPIWRDLLAARDESDPLIRLAYHYHEIAQGRASRAHAHGIDALRAAPPPGLADVLDAAGLLFAP
ncbi:MAG: SIR2 family protein [Polyangiaceae bacterium]|nr:SIR2 family protein [Polyangiaceae bacterium]